MTQWKQTIRAVLAAAALAFGAAAAAGQGTTPLHEAVQAGDVDAVVALLLEKKGLLAEYGADVDAEDSRGRTPLHYAAQNESGIEIVALLLLLAGADPDAVDEYEYGRTPLHWAALHGHTHIAEWLLLAGADKDARDNSDQTPLDLAEANGHYDVVELLRDPRRY